MNILLILLIFFGVISVLELFLCVFFGWKYFKYKTKTPADIFLKARRKKHPMLVSYLDTNILRFEVSEDKENLIIDGKVISKNAGTGFLEEKSQVQIFANYVSPAKDGRVIDPQAVAFVEEVDYRMKKTGKPKDEIIKDITNEQEKNQKVETRYGTLSFERIVDYFGYEDASDTYAVANRMANWKTKEDKKILKYLLFFVIGAIGVGVLIFSIAMASKILTNNPEVVVKMPDIVSQLASQANQTINQTIKP